MTDAKLLETIKYNVTFLQGAGDEALPEIKDIVCKFYKGGRCPSCKGCLQPVEQVMECKEAYVQRIETHPMEKWAATFEMAKKRRKQKIAEVVELGLSCDNCYLSGSCPLYEADALCAIDWDEEGTLSPKQIVEKLIQLQYKRINRASRVEEIDGGVPDVNLSAEIDRMQGLVMARNELNMDRFSVKIEGQAQNNGSGLLQKLLGGQTQQPQLQQPVTIDVPVREVQTEKRKK